MMQRNWKRGTGVLSAAVAAAASGLFAPPAGAVTKDWTGGTDALWDTAGNWNPANEPAAGDDAIFPAGIPGTGGTITLTAGELAGSLTFRNSYTLTGGNLTLNSPGTVVVTAGSTATINSALIGASGLTLAANNGALGDTGGGTLILGGINTFTGPVNINAGVLEINGTTNTTNTAATDVANRLGAANNVVNLNGGTLRYNSSNSIRFPSDASALNQHVFNILAGGGTFDTPNGQFEIRNTADSLTAVAGAVLTKTGAGALRVASANPAFNAGASVVVNGGVLESGTANSFGTAPITVNAGNVSGNGDLANALTLAGGTISPVNGDRTFTGAVTVNAGSTVSLKDWYQNTGRNLTLNNAITGSGALNVGGVGGGQRLVLSGNNAGFSGAVNVTPGHNVVYVNANSVGTGVTEIESNASSLGGVGYGFDFGATVPAFTNVTTAVPVGGVFGINTVLAATTTLDLQTLGGGGMFLGSQTGGTYSAATLGASFSFNSVYRLGGGQGNLSLPNVILTDSGATPVGLVVGDGRGNGGGTVTFASNASTFTGPVSINQGTLSVTDVANGGTASPLGAGTSAITIGGQAGGTLTYAGAASDSTDRSFLIGVSGGAINVTTAAATLSVPQIGLAGVTGGFTKGGAGTLLFSGPAGGITVTTLTMNGGTLDLGAKNLTLSNAGANTLKGTNSVSTINASNGGSLIISTAGGTNYGDNSVVAGGTITVNAKVSGADNTAGFEYCCDNPGGTIVLANAANDFQGDVYFNSAGTISVPAVGNQNAASSPLGRGTTVFFNQVSGTTGARLLFTGPAETTNRILSLGNVAATLDASGTGKVTYTSNIAVVNTAAKTLTLTGTGQGEISGLIPDNTASTNILKAGAGTWTLSGANTYTGLTQVDAGILNVASVSDYGVPSAIGARTAAVETATGNGIGIWLRGGTLQYTGSTPQSTNRQIRILGSTGGVTNTIDASGSLPTATLSFTFAGPNTNLFDTVGIRTLALTGTNTGENTFTIPLANQATNVTNLTKSGVGTWLVNGNNTYTGTTTVQAGVLRVTSATALGGPGTGAPQTNIVGNAGGTGRLELAGNITVGETIQIEARQAASVDVPALSNFSGNNTITAQVVGVTGGSDYNVESQAGLLTLAGGYANTAGTGTRNLKLMGAGNGLVSGAILNGTAGPLTLTKLGGGTWTLTGNNALTGQVSVNAGTLLANNTTAGQSSTGTGPVVVGGTGVLGGIGFITGAVTANAGGSVAPGASAGVLTIANNLTFNNNSTLAYEIGASPATSDLVNLTGAGVVAFGSGTTWNLNITNPTAADLTGQTYTLIDYAGADPAALPAIAFTGPLSGTVAIDAVNTRITLTNVTAVPEPAAFGLIGLAGAALLGRRRRAAR